MRRLPVYTPAAFGMVRTPSFPVANDLPVFGHDSLEGASGPHLVSFLRSVAERQYLREAVAVSAPALSDVLDRVMEGRPVKRSQLERAVVALTRYLIRAANRPTPFGLLAGVAPVSFGADVRVRVGDDHRRHSRVDSGWLAEVVRGLERRSDVLPGLRVVVNDLCVVKGGRVQVPVHGVADGSGASRRAPQPGGRASVPLNDVVREVLELARQPIACPDLVERISAAYAPVSAGRVGAMLIQLIEQEVLLTDLHPSPDEPDPLGYVLKRLSVLGPDPVRYGLEEVGRLLDRYDTGRQGHALADLRRAGSTAAKLSPQRPFLQVDLRADVDVVLPAAVAREAAAAAGALWRMSPPRRHLSQQLQRYHSVFLEHYGESTVPLTDMLDPERGIGLPAGYPGSASGEGEQPDPVAPEAKRARLALLAELACTTAAAGRHEVALTDAQVDRLSIDLGLPPTSTAEICVQVHAESPEALARGEFLLSVNGSAGSWQAGAMFGRFAHLLPEIAPRLRQEFTRAAAARGIPVQLSCRTSSDAAGNVVRTPRWTEHAIHVGEFCSPGEDGALRASDVLVSADEDGFHLWSPALDEELLPLTANMLVPSWINTPAARFVREIASNGQQGWQSWSWGDNAGLPHLPRVRYGRSILSPETWRASWAMVESLGDPTRWPVELAAWRERYAVPARIRTSFTDQQLELDLDDPLHRRIVHDELRRRPGTVFQESLLDREAGSGWLGGRVAEIVVPMTAAPPVRPQAQQNERKRRGRRGAAAAGPAVVHPIGGEWLYAKLHASPRLHGELLAEHLAPLVTELGPLVDRWFFIRYADPAPHLRLRLHGAPERLLTEALPLLRNRAERLRGEGLLRTWTLDAYEPETQRYGGLPVLAAAEEVFRADSDCVLDQLRLVRTKSLTADPQLLAALNFVDLCRGMLPEHWAEWLLGAYPRDHHREAFRARRTELRALAPLDWDTALARATGTDPGRPWAARRSAVCRYRDRLAEQGHAGPQDPVQGGALASLLHMHHNRAVGIDRASEGTALSLARGFAELSLTAARYAR